MKRLIFIITAFCLAAISSAQTRKLNQGSTTTTDTTINSGMTRKKLSNGNMLLHTVAGKYKLYATYANNKVVDYYVIDTKGKKHPARIVTKQDNYSARRLKCYTCVKVVDADTGKSAEECEEIPCPDSIMGEKTTIRTAQ
jgi:hypothetical protein